MEATRIHDDQVSGEGPATAPVLGAVGDQCPACGGRLASDQRYCLSCGERRGKARFGVDSMTVPQEPAAAPAAPPRRRPVLSSSATLITGIATLLLAMGVGVLIGRSGSDAGRRASSPAVQVVTAGGSAGTAVASGSSSAAAKKAAKAVKHPVITKAVAAKAQAAAAKVIGGHNLPPPTVKVGQTGHGPGYKNGKFTGDYFGQ
jgi:hypothetical protein